MSEIDLKRFFLEQVPLFASFPADKVEEIVIKSRLATFEGNEAMLETGDETRHFGIMISGHAEISSADNTGTRTVRITSYNVCYTKLLRERSRSYCRRTRENSLQL